MCYKNTRLTNVTPYVIHHNYQNQYRRYFLHFQETQNDVTGYSALTKIG